MVDLVVVVGTCLFVVKYIDYYFEGFGAPVVTDLLVGLLEGSQVGLQVGQKGFKVLGLPVVEKVIDLRLVESPEL